MQVIHTKDADVPERVGNVDHHVAVPLEQWHEIGEWEFQPIHFAVLQCGGGGCGFGDDDPFDAVNQHALAASEP